MTTAPSPETVEHTQRVRRRRSIEDLGTVIVPRLRDDTHTFLVVRRPTASASTPASTPRSARRFHAANLVVAAGAGSALVALGALFAIAATSPAAAIRAPHDVSAPTASAAAPSDAAAPQERAAAPAPASGEPLPLVALDTRTEPLALVVAPAAVRDVHPAPVQARHRAVARPASKPSARAQASGDDEVLFERVFTARDPR